MAHRIWILEEHTDHGRDTTTRELGRYTRETLATDDLIRREESTHPENVGFSLAGPIDPNKCCPDCGKPGSEGMYCDDCRVASAVMPEVR